MEEFIKGLPKVELHLHIEGSMEPEMIFRLAQRNGIALAHDSIESLKKAYAFRDLQSFLNLYYDNMQVLVNEEDFLDVTYAYFERIAADNVIHTEIFFDPQAHLARGVAIETQLAGIAQGCQKARETLGISSEIILSFLRDMSEESALATLEAALPYRDHFIGVGLDSAEVGNPPEKFERVFAKAAELGLYRVAHAGEEGSHEYITGALDSLHVQRIDHGVRSLESDALVDRLVELNMPLTVCPLSNIYLKVFDDMAQHTLRKMFDKGLNVTLNSDDPAYFGGYMNDNFLAVQQAFDFDRETWARLTRNAIDASFASNERKAQMHDALARYLTYNK
ncbi:Adenine deaminase [Halomonadaceae bacterium LMG 33818]|uniref:adenosine deaminase n=1 Tax=Cernens ardua TaxID=3402176 RepID=UPI003EDBFF0C